MFEKMLDMVQSHQRTICDGLDALNQAGVQSDEWQRPGGGGGLTCIIKEGAVFEKGGVNVANVSGPISKEMALTLGVPIDQIQNYQFKATGLSIVLHPSNPMVPTIHSNYRYFELLDASQAIQTWWFGGGTDLTPYYLFEDDCKHFHGVFQSACNAHFTDLYPELKQACDQYFFLPHRQEHRGIGGIFFLKKNDADPEALFSFVFDCSSKFLDSYLPIVHRRNSLSYSAAEKDWQLFRRSRYVEFNLLYDLGTKFGLQSNGRTESILMSMPPQANWIYNKQAKAGTKEWDMQAVLREPKDWV